MLLFLMVLWFALLYILFKKNYVSVLTFFLIMFFPPQENLRWVLELELKVLEFLSLYKHFIPTPCPHSSNQSLPGPGWRSIQLLSRRSVDWGCLSTRHACRSVCLGWSINWSQWKAKCFWNWAGNSQVTTAVAY